MRRRDERGVVLLVVLFFALLLSSTVATFLRKATIDTLIVRNREATSRADALARGGVRLATALLLEDQARKAALPGPNSALDLWSLVSGYEIPAGDGASLRLRIEDAGARLNLNAAFQFDEAGNPNPNAVPLLEALLEKVIDEMPVPPGEKVYDQAALVADLIDYVDADDVRQRGGPEDDTRAFQDVAYVNANRPLLSLDELRSIRGFDEKLVDALRPYLTVYPFAGTGGINPNTAPPHVLALLFFDDGVELRLAPEDVVREILTIRQDGGLLCGEGQSAETCTPMREVVTNAIYPPASFTGDIFTVVAEARVGEVRRSIEAVLDRRETPPLLLSWRVL